MTANRFFFLILSALIGVLGLFTAAAARETGLLIFGWGMVGFGILFAFFLVKLTYDEADARRG